MGDINFDLRSLLEVISEGQLRHIALSALDIAAYLEASQYRDYLKPGMRVHELKAVEEFFFPLQSFDKNFEIRKNDRDFKVGDILLIRLWDEVNKVYPGACVRKVVRYVCDFQQKKGYVVLGF